jgi:hypothetical protein
MGARGYKNNRHNDSGGKKIAISNVLFRGGTSPLTIIYLSFHKT